MRAALALLCSLPIGLLACGADDVAPGPLPPPGPGEGFQLSFETTVPAGSELWQCKISRLPTTEYTAVNHVRSVQTLGVHHMDVMALVFAGLALDEGVYDCKDLYRDHPELMEDGLIIYAAQQPEQEITLPSDTVAYLPGGLLVMQEIHYLNTSPDPIDAYSKINIYKYDQPFTKEIWGSAVRDVHMDIPPGESVQWTRCVMNEPVDLLFLSSHTHALARKVEVRHFDGQTAGAMMYENNDWATPALQAYGTPLHVPAGQGFEFACHYRNPGTSTVHWGFAASDEMCQIALVYTPGLASRKCEVVETSDAVLPQ